MQQASTFFWTWGAPLSKPSASLSDTLSSIPNFRPDILKLTPYQEIILSDFTLFISKVELDHFGLTIYVVVFLLLVFSGAFERLITYFS